MLHLGIDTSAGPAVAVVDDDGRLLASAVEPTLRRHAEDLAPQIAGVLRDAGAGVGQVGDVVVGTGPAPFTGLRVGLVTAATLGFALGVPVLGVPSPAAVAVRAFDLADLDDDPATEVLTVTDARRREVHWARWVRDPRLGVRAVDGPAVGAPGVVPTAGALLAGRAAGFVGPVRDAFGVLDPDPAALVAVALLRRAHGEPTPTAPLYLRRPDAVPPTAAGGAVLRP